MPEGAPTPTEPGLEPRRSRIERLLLGPDGQRGLWIFIWLIIISGIYTGYRLGQLPKLESYKLVNLTGLIDTFLGVWLLADIVVTNPGWQKIGVEILAPAMLWLHGLFPLCVYLGAATVDVFKTGALPKLFPYGFLVVNWCGLVAMLLEEVAYPRLKWFQGGFDLRYRRFGLILVLNGVTLQLVAGFLEIGSILSAG